jgi:LysM repeat protein
MTSHPLPAVPPVLRSAAATACVSLFALLATPGAADAQSPCGPTETVQAGDTLFSIAQRCDTTVAALQEANPQVDPHDMAIGMTLQIAAAPGELRPVEPQPEAPPAGEHYTVQPGDTPASIAAALGITVQALLAANPEIDPDALMVGQTIILPGAPGMPDAPPDDRRTVIGVMTDEGVECQAMRGQDGQLYTLIGDLEGYGSGDPVEVRGSEPEVDFCQQGVTIEVEDIRGVG